MKYYLIYFHQDIFHPFLLFIACAMLTAAQHLKPKDGTNTTNLFNTAYGILCDHQLIETVDMDMSKTTFVFVLAGYPEYTGLFKSRDLAASLNCR